MHMYVAAAAGKAGTSIPRQAGPVCDLVGRASGTQKPLRIKLPIAVTAVSSGSTHPDVRADGDYPSRNMYRVSQVRAEHGPLICFTSQVPTVLKSNAARIHHR
jgi:hypothetical protein